MNHYKYKCGSFDSQQMAPPDENGISVPDAELTAQTKQLELHAAKCDTIIAQGKRGENQTTQRRIKEVSLCD